MRSLPLKFIANRICWLQFQRLAMPSCPLIGGIRSRWISSVHITLCISLHRVSQFCRLFSVSGFLEPPPFRTHTAKHSELKVCTRRLQSKIHFQVISAPKQKQTASSGFRSLPEQCGSSSRRCVRCVCVCPACARRFPADPLGKTFGN